MEYSLQSMYSAASHMVDAGGLVCGTCMHIHPSHKILNDMAYVWNLGIFVSDSTQCTTL